MSNHHDALTGHRKVTITVTVTVTYARNPKLQNTCIVHYNSLQCCTPVHELNNFEP